MRDDNDEKIEEPQDKVKQFLKDLEYWAVPKVEDIRYSTPYLGGSNSKLWRGTENPDYVEGEDDESMQRLPLVIAGRCINRLVAPLVVIVVLYVVMFVLTLIF